MVETPKLGGRRRVARTLECLAFVTGAQAQANAPEKAAAYYRHAAMLLGAAEALREQAQLPMGFWEKSEYDRDFPPLQPHLEDAASREAWAEGRMMTIEQAIEYAMKFASHERN